MTTPTLSQDEAKKVAAQRSLTFVRDGMTLGLGSGTTAAHVVDALGAAMKQQGLRVTAVPSSEETAARARAVGIPLIDLEAADRLDVMIDGADEVDPGGGMIKGRGGALLREKVLAKLARQLIIVVDRSKLVSVLGHHPLPVEVVAFAQPPVRRMLEAAGLRPVLRRRAAGDIYETDQGNLILDCHTGPLADPAALAARLDATVGVVEHGLFLGFSPEVIVGD